MKRLKKSISILLVILLVLSTSLTGLVSSASATSVVELAFVIDTTGSMAGAVTNLRNNIRTFVETLEANDLGLTIKLSLVEYKDITVEGLSSTRVHTYNGAVWMDVDGFLIALNTLVVGGGGDDPETAVDALGYLVQDTSPLKWSADSYKFAFLLTDAVNKMDNRWGYTSMDAIAADLKAANINTSVIATDSPAVRASYAPLYEQTGGIFVNLNSAFAGALEQLAYSIIRVIVTTHHVTFVDWDGRQIDRQSVVEGNIAIAPTDPDRLEYIFAGWYLEDVLFDFSTPITEDITLVARWTPEREPISTLRIATAQNTPAPSLVTLPRNSSVQFSVLLNANASPEGIVWQISDTTFATVTQNGLVTTRGSAGSVVLTATADTGVTHSIALRIL